MRIWEIDHFVERAHNWLEQRSVKDDYAKLTQKLLDPNAPPHGIVNRLMTIATWRMTRGAIQVCDGDSDGWKEIHLAWRCDAIRTYVNFRLRDELPHMFVDRRAKVAMDLEDTVTTLLLAIALREDTYAIWCGERLIKSLSPDDKYYQPKTWDYCDPLGAFAVHLFCRWTNSAIENEQPPELNVYQRVMERWIDGDDESLRWPLIDVCRKHCQIAVVATNSSEPMGPLGRSPYDFFPIEILALRRVREDLNLKTPDVPHPLVDTPLGQPPATLPKSEVEEFIALVIDHCRTTLPNLEIPWNTN